MSFVYEDANGHGIYLNPYNPEYTNNASMVAPGCKNSRNTDVSVVRGALLDPDQCKYVIENQLVFRGLWMEVVRETPPKAGGSDPGGYFYNFTPWILGDTRMFDDGYYLSPYDPGYLYNGSYKDLDNFYTTRGIQQRREYFDKLPVTNKRTPARSEYI